MEVSKSTNLQILFVDDDTDELMIFHEALNELATTYQVTHILNCEGLEYFFESADFLPDVIFLDINMPGINGMDCLKMIRDKSDYKTVPIFMYSTSSNKHHIQQSRESGADLYIVKQSSFNKTKMIFQTVFSTLQHHTFNLLKERFVLP